MKFFGGGQGMAQFKDSNPFETLPQSNFPLQPDIVELIEDYVKCELMSGVDNVVFKVNKAIDHNEKSVIIYTISTEGLLKYYKALYSHCCSDIICNILSNITTRELLQHIEKSELYKEIYEELLKRGYRAYIRYDNFMDLRSVDITIIIK